MRKLSNIQVLRGLAALAVVVFHARDEVDGAGIATRLPSFIAGAFGVDLFFVVSGLVMVHASAPLFGAARSALPFMGKRLARIVPLYWAVTALFVLLDPADARGGLGRPAFGRFVALSLAFVPYAAPANADANPVYSLGWTLDYEMAFYLAFALVLALPRRGAVAALASAFAGLVVWNEAAALPGWLAYLGRAAEPVRFPRRPRGGGSHGGAAAAGEAAPERRAASRLSRCGTLFIGAEQSSGRSPPWP